MSMKILFICSHNSSRSQMAEALVNHHFKFKASAFSGGVSPSHINRRAIKVLLEEGIDISRQVSKSYIDFSEWKFDKVISLCDVADKTLPRRFGGTDRIHLSLPNPTICDGTDEEKDQLFRDVKNMLKSHLHQIFP